MSHLHTLIERFLNLYRREFILCSDIFIHNQKKEFTDHLSKAFLDKLMNIAEYLKEEKVDEREKEIAEDILTYFNFKDKINDRLHYYSVAYYYYHWKYSENEEEMNSDRAYVKENIDSKEKFHEKIEKFLDMFNKYAPEFFPIE